MQPDVSVSEVPTTNIISDDDKPNAENINEPVLDILGNGLLKKKVLKKGLGEASRPNHGDSVVVSYKGFLEDGTLVEESSSQRFVLGEGECIHAFDLSITLSELKEEFELTTDSRFAYGDLGREPNIPGKATLIYHITLEECDDPPKYNAMPKEQRYQIADCKRERGNFFFGRNEFQYALTCYTKAIEILTKSALSSVKPSDSAQFPQCTQKQVWELELKLKNNIGATQLKLEAFSPAVKTCDTVLQMDPNNFKALFRKGVALARMGEWPESIAVFERVLELAPSSARTKTELAQARETWKKQRERHVRAFSKHNSLKKPTEKSATNTFYNLCSRYRIALSALLIAGLSVTLGTAMLRYNA